MVATHPLAQRMPVSYSSADNGEYMNDAQLADFRQVLLEWKQSLLDDVGRTVNHMQDEATAFPDPNDRATQEEEFSLELRTRDRERKLLKKISESLAQIESGDYGYCETCGIAIGLPRMRARPTATRCIDCKMLEEVREKRGG
ncbi:MAG: RNA polymerase-binding protein DksA [Candidatus Competibacteraceae bacterium]|nr:RNA polymerase-binding protein DksA [Candidatus Competibacteraceae bacterium]